jgi:hypothetical protein
MAIEIKRPDGFVLVHSPGTGWDIHAPARHINREQLADILRLVDRRTHQDLTRDGIERRRGPWMGWVLEQHQAEAKIALEKRQRLFH